MRVLQCRKRIRPALCLLTLACLQPLGARVVEVRAGGGISLKQAFLALEAGDVLEVSEGLYEGRSNCGLEIAASGVVVRAAPGGAAPVIDCHGTGLRALAILGSNVTVSGLILRRGSPRAPAPGEKPCRGGDTRCLHGGCLLILGKEVRVSDVRMEECEASDNAGRGGCLRVDNEASAELERVAMVGCRSPRGAAMCMQLSSSLVLRNCEVRDNVASMHAGGMYMWMSTFTAVDTVFSNNSALDGTGGVLLGVLYSVISLLRCSINDNYAFEEGGAVFLYGTNWLSATHTNFSRNSGLYGGAICAMSTVAIDMESCSFDGNTASRYGAIMAEGADVSFSHSSFTNNAADLGGAVGVTSGGSLILVSVVMAGNSGGARGGGGVP